MWLWIACLLALVTVIAFYAWTIYYFNNSYPYDKVYVGMGDRDDPDNYDKTTKKTYVIIQVLILVGLSALLIYSTVACVSWQRIADEQ